MVVIKSCAADHAINSGEFLVLYFIRFFGSVTIWIGYFSLTSNGRQPVGINQIRSLSIIRFVRHASFTSCHICLKLMITGFQVCACLSVPYTGFTLSISGWKVPNSLSQIIKI